MKKLLMMTCCVFSLTACNIEQDNNKAEDEQSRTTKKIQAEANKQVGMPDIINFQERRFAKMILEMRDKAITTYTYFIDLNGKMHFICESVGYGLPYSVQYTNPVKIEDDPNGSVDAGSAITPQAEPNGLYMPDGLSATWVLCADKKGGVQPIYVEPQIIVSPFKMD